MTAGPPPVRPRVALVHSILFFGSTEWYLRTLVERLSREFEIHLVAPDDAALAELAAAPGFAGWIVPAASHATGAPTVAALRAYRAALARLEPEIVHFGDIDPPAMLAARLAGLRRTVVTWHTPEQAPNDNAVGRLLRRLAWLTLPEVVFTSDEDRRTGLARAPIEVARTAVIPFGIDIDRFAPRPRDDGRNGRVVGTVGLLRRQKRHDVLVEAAALVVAAEPDVRFVVVGEGEEREALERLVAERGLEGHFDLVGMQDDVPAWLASFDVFALSSDFEGMCLAVAEAMAAELPVVATAVGGVRHSVADGETGLLVSPGDAAALASGILELLRHPHRARAFGRAGRDRVRRLYDLDRMVEATAEVYRRTLAR